MPEKNDFKLQIKKPLATDKKQKRVFKGFFYCYESTIRYMKGQNYQQLFSINVLGIICKLLIITEN